MLIGMKFTDDHKAAPGMKNHDYKALPAHILSPIRKHICKQIVLLENEKK